MYVRQSDKVVCSDTLSNAIQTLQANIAKCILEKT